MKFKEWFLIESKNSIVNLKYPEIIATLLYKRFKNNAPLIAKWFREYKFSSEIPDNWWLQSAGSLRQTPSLYDLTTLYTATSSPEEYKKALEKLEIDDDGLIDLEEEKKALQAQIEDKFFKEAFFTYNLIKNIENGKLKDVSPYKNMKFWDAQHKYDEKNIFQDTTPLKTYPNGFKWINVGKRCYLVGNLMKNCGSAGLMSMDNDAVMVVLFGPENTPHVVVTYSPNEKRISGDEGIASSEVKSKYHNYILDLAKTLGVNFDAHKSKSTLLKMKYLLQSKSADVRQLNQNDIYDQRFTVNMQGKVYYSNGYALVSKEDVEKVQNAMKQGVLTLANNQKSIIKNIFNHLNQPILAKFGVEYIPLK